MEFRDLKKQYEVLKTQIDDEITKVIQASNFISGKQVRELEEQLAEYVGCSHCITCANGTDALSLVLMAWNIGENDAVFIPDFTFFATGEVVSFANATPIFVDVEQDTYNIDPIKLEEAILQTIKEGSFTPKAIISVDLFGQPANYPELERIAAKYNLYLLEDGAQGFGGRIGTKKACSFGNAATTSFFPAKPLGCYGDGGAIFTNNDELAVLLRSLSIHGKGSFKYDNVRIGMNSRLDTMQAAILLPKFKAFKEYELSDINKAADYYTSSLGNYVTIPVIKDNYYSSWAQYTIQLNDAEERDGLQQVLRENGIPSMIYYPKPMHQQTAFSNLTFDENALHTTTILCTRVLALPIHPYMVKDEQEIVIQKILNYLKK